jgi:hypothetical protein
MPKGQIMVVRHEAHTGLSATFAAATAMGAAVKVTAAKTVSPVAAGTDVAVGVSHHEITAQNITDGENRGTFRLKGDVIPMKSSAAIAAGAQVELAAAGKVATKSTGGLFGIAWTASTAADQEILIIVL